MYNAHTPRQNRLLAALPAIEYERLARHLEWVQILPGEVLYEPGEQLRYAYFPTTAIVSLLYVTADGVTAEVAGVGNEGMLGVALVMGGEIMRNIATAQCAGCAYRLKSQVLKVEFNRAGGRRSGALQNLLLRYSQAVSNQASQLAVCNRHHSVEQRLCRWLLAGLDRSASSELTITQEFVASALGVRREGITAASGKLQHANLIRCRRGHITVLDRPALETRSCECYRAAKAEFDRLLPNGTAMAVAEPRYIRRPRDVSHPLLV